MFTDVTINTAAPYIHVVSATTQGGGPLSLDTFPNTQFTASDSETSSPFYRTVNLGDVFGLAHVSYAVSSNIAIGSTYTIGIESVNVGTSLSDINGTLIPFTGVNGVLSVVSSTIPEPWALTQATTAALIALGAFLWRRWRSATRCAVPDGRDMYVR